MIEICFNELTVSPLCENLTEIEERVNTYVNLLMRIQSYFGSKTKIRYEYGLEDVFLTKELSLASFCLVHTDKGLGLVIETTASNIYQGKAIAKYIEENYKC